VCHFDSLVTVDPRPLIVLAEDSADLRTLLSAALELIGYRVVQVETGAKLIEAVRELRAQQARLRLIVTDVRMPTVGGLEAARAIRDSGETAPLIFMTAYGDAWTRAKAAELGAVLLDKPLSLGLFRETVAKVMGE
jgi:CheY-like chemotaxis protein